MSKKFGLVTVTLAMLVILGCAAQTGREATFGKLPPEIQAIGAGAGNAVTPPADSVTSKPVIKTIQQATEVANKEWEKSTDRIEGSNPFLGYDLTFSQDQKTANWWIEITNPTAETRIYEVSFGWKGTYTDWIKEPVVEVVIDPQEKKRIEGSRTLKAVLGTLNGKHVAVNPKKTIPAEKEINGPWLVETKQIVATEKEVIFSWEVPICVTKHTIIAWAKNVEPTFWETKPTDVKVDVIICDWDYNELCRVTDTVKAEPGIFTKAKGTFKLPKGIAAKHAGNFNFKTSINALNYEVVKSETIVEKK